jgi:cytochrome c553
LGSRSNCATIDEGAQDEFTRAHLVYNRRMHRHCIAGLILYAALASGAPCTLHAAELEPMVPAWLYPLSPPKPAGAPAADARVLLRLPGSDRAFTAAQLADRFAVPDWHPRSHTPMPDIVAHGRTPEVNACGYCHLPGGGGRPENASLAGLPAAYIVRQVIAMRSGARRSAWSGAPYVPIELMRALAPYVTDDDLSAAAAYFAAQKLAPRVIVAERTRIPRVRIAAWIYAPDAAGGEEPLGERLIEMAPDFERHEMRDDRMRYVAYVPPGSIARGRAIARNGAHGPTSACLSCHGAGLRGAGDAPPLAGRSPSYVLRQLLAFQTQARGGPAALPMQAVVAKLPLADLIAIAAYSASCPP